MNVAVINLKVISKNFFKLVLGIICLIFIVKILITNVNILQNILSFKVCSSLYTSLFTNINNESFQLDYITPVKAFYPFVITETDREISIGDSISEVNGHELQIVIPRNANVETVSERNISENYNLTYSNVKIRNQSDYELTDSILSLDDSVLINNKKILIYHTHTCESYTPSEKYNYTMTGNYRTTDKSYSVVRLRR